MDVSQARERVQELSDDQSAIHQLLLRYADCVYRDDGAGLAALFAPGGVLESHGHVRTSEQLISSVAENAKKFKRTILTLQCPFILIDGDRASGNTSCMMHHFTPASHDQYANYTNCVTFHDRFVRAPGGWLFERRNAVIEYRQMSMVDNVP